jgi:hypothetical protein
MGDEGKQAMLQGGVSGPPPYPCVFGGDTEKNMRFWCDTRFCIFFPLFFGFGGDFFSALMVVTKNHPHVVVTSTNRATFGGDKALSAVKMFKNGGDMCSFGGDMCGFGGEYPRHGGDKSSFGGE